MIQIHAEHGLRKDNGMGQPVGIAHSPQGMFDGVNAAFLGITLNSLHMATQQFGNLPDRAKTQFTLGCHLATAFENQLPLLV